MDQRRRDMLFMLAGGAAVLVVVGAFLPWVKATAPLVGQITQSGVGDGGDGLYTLILGMAVIASLGWNYLGQPVGSRPGRSLFVLLGLAGLAIAAVAIMDMGEVGDRRDAIGSDLVIVSTGEGLYMTLIGGVGVLAAGVLGFGQSTPGGPTPGRRYNARRRR